MAITLGSNIASLRGQRQLAQTSSELGTVFQRLSSGQRINKASDDAAGLSIADSLNAKSRIYNQGIRNLNDGQSLLTIADSAVEVLGGIVIRLEELAVQSANGVYTNKQRKAMDDEAQALSKEFFRISKATEFNGQRLLSGEFDTVNLQAGVGAHSVLSAGVGGAIGIGTLGGLNLVGSNGLRKEAVDLGDINGDGNLDIVALGVNGFASVMLGSGGGAFSAATTYAMHGANGYDVELGDLDGDGVLDLVSTGRTLGANYVVFRLGSGDGSFSAARSFASSNARALSLADANNDGIIDILTGTTASTVNVHMGLGAGAFGSAAAYSSMPSVDITVADLNNDGIVDLVTGGSSGFDSVLSTRLGLGDGSFGAVSSTVYVGAIGIAKLTVADVNNDGNGDILHGGLGTGQVVVRLGDGEGSFNVSLSFGLPGTTVTGVAAADLNGDGLLDIIGASTGGPGGPASVFLGDGVGRFTFSQNYSMNAGDPLALAVGDVDGDGVTDVVTAGYDVYGASSDIVIRLGTSRSGVAPLLPFSLVTLADARQALPVFKRKREQLAEQRGEIGAFQSRIDIARNVLEVSSENFRAAESRIRDADIAEESSRLVRLNILQQAATSVLAQANQQPALALQLLRG